MNKNMRAGFQGQHDSMRALADKLMNHPGNPNKEPVRLYKEGGSVKKTTKKECSCNKFAAGGVAKIRHKEATPSGNPLKQRRSCKKGK